MNREAWCATVHGVAKSRTWLSDWTARSSVSEIEGTACLSPLVTGEQEQHCRWSPTDCVTDQDAMGPSQDRGGASPISSALAPLWSTCWIENRMWCTFPELFCKCDTPYPTKWNKLTDWLSWMPSPGPPGASGLRMLISMTQPCYHITHHTKPTKQRIVRELITHPETLRPWEPIRSSRLFRARVTGSPCLPCNTVCLTSWCVGHMNTC